MGTTPKRSEKDQEVSNRCVKYFCFPEYPNKVLCVSLL